MRACPIVKVAGQAPGLLQARDLGKPKVVAGVGFEPTTFGL